MTKEYEKNLVERICFEYGFFSVHISRHFSDDTVYTQITNSAGDTLQSGKYATTYDALQDVKQYMESTRVYAEVLLYKVNELRKNYDTFFCLDGHSEKYEKNLIERMCFEYGFFSVHISRRINNSDDSTVHTQITNSKGNILYSGKHKYVCDALQDIKQYIESMCSYAAVLLSKVNELCDKYNDFVVS